MRLIQTSFFLLCSLVAIGQITVESNTLPDVGDELVYTNLILPEDTIMAYRETGENFVWTFNEFELGGQMIEAYTDINTTTLADSFPDSDMIITLGLFDAAATREPNRIVVNGINTGGFGGFEIDASLQLSNDYTIRETPLLFGTVNSDDVNLIFTFDAALIPGIDSLDLGGLPGSIDSIRVTTELTREEEVIGWGTVNVMDESREVLHVREENTTDVLLEVGVNVLGFLIWFDVSDLFGMGGFGGAQTATTFRFVDADNTAAVIEFTENIIPDTLGNEMVMVTGRTGLELDVSSTNNPTLFNQLDLTVFPNPASDYITIDVVNYNQALDVTLYNHLGQLEGQWHNFTNGTQLDVSQLDEGNYIILTQTADRELYQKLIIMR